MGLKFANQLPKSKVETTPHEIPWEGIKIGYTISQTFCGVTTTGVVARLGSDAVWTSDGRYIAHRYSPVFLVSRPAPELPTKEGSVILDVELTDGCRARFSVYLPAANGDRFPWRLVDSGSHQRWASPEEIIAWTPAEVGAIGERVLL